MRGIEHQHWLQLALYDPLERSGSARRLSQPFAPTVADRLFLKRVIRHFHRMSAERGDIWMNLGVFPWVHTDDDSRWYSA